MIQQKTSIYFTKADYPKVLKYAEKRGINSASELVLRAIDNVSELSERYEHFTSNEKTYLSEIENLKTALENAKKEHETIANAVIEYQELIAEFHTATEKAFMLLFGESEPIKITFKDMLRLMLDYCERDPSEEFPFEPVAREIYERIKKQQYEIAPEITE